jgi:tetratricopeptide (TPR) repeat protein
MSAKMAAFAGKLFVACLSVGLAGALLYLPVRSPRTAEFDAGRLSDYHGLATRAARDSESVKQDELANFAENLARAGLFEDARAAARRIDPRGPRGSFYRAQADRAISLNQVAAAAWEGPQRVTSFAPVDALSAASGPDASEASARNYWLLAEQILNRSPWTGVNPQLGKLLHPKVLHREPNATLHELLYTRWPRVIESLPEKEQGWLWDYMAQIWIEVGDYRAATDALERAESSGAYDFQGINQIFNLNMTSRNWLEMGMIDRAIAASRNASSKSGPVMIKNDIARALIAAGDKHKALIILDEALADIRALSTAGSRQLGSPMQFLLGIVNLRQTAGDHEGAHLVAEEMLASAKRPNLFPASEMALAAAGFNNLGEHQRAADILHEAIAKVPGPNQKLGVGVTLGPITGSTLGVGDSIRSQVAVELYRAGDRIAFEELLHDLPSWYRARTWTDLYGVFGQHGQDRPSKREVIDQLPPDAKLGFLNDLATEALSNGEFDEAKELLQRLVRDSEAVSAARFLTGVAKVAVAGDFVDIAREALHSAARIALRNNDRGQRASDLALIAALQHELLSD